MKKADDDKVDELKTEIKKVDKKIAKEQGEVDKAKDEANANQVSPTTPDSKTPELDEQKKLKKKLDKDLEE